MKRLERAACSEMMTLKCPECGAEFKVYEDLGLEYLAREWVQESGAESHRETRPDVLRSNEHEHDASLFIDKATGEPFLGEFFRGLVQMPPASDVEDLSEP